MSGRRCAPLEKGRDGALRRNKLYLLPRELDSGGIPTPNMTPTPRSGAHGFGRANASFDTDTGTPPREHDKRTLPFNNPACRGPRVSTSWRVALARFQQSQAVNEIMGALDLMANLLESTPEAGLAGCREDFQDAVTAKRRSSPDLFMSIVNRMVVTLVANHFKNEITNRLPEHVLQNVMSYVPLVENGTLCAVSQGWAALAEDDCLWKGAYHAKFTTTTTPPPPTTTVAAAATETPAGEAAGAADEGQGGESQGQGTAAAAVAAAGAPEDLPAQHHHKEGYRQRLEDPRVGDKVEVAWRGKFRLESLEIYNGLAWWLAVVVGKGEGGYYQVHYPGWESRWDEWVPRSRLRWGNANKAAALAGHRPCVDDTVEIWCGGVNVPGAWLEATVHKVKGTRLYLGEMLTTGHFWVDEENVRLVKKASALACGDGGYACLGLAVSAPCSPTRWSPQRMSIAPMAGAGANHLAPPAGAAEGEGVDADGAGAGGGGGAGGGEGALPGRFRTMVERCITM